MKVSTLFTLGGLSGVSSSTVPRLFQDNSAEVAQRATSEETHLALGGVAGSGAAGVRVSVPIAILPRDEDHENEIARRATSEETELALGDVSGSGAAGIRVSVPNAHVASPGKARRATSEETPLSLDDISGSGAAGVRVSIPNLQTKRATGEETSLSLDNLSGSGAAGVRVNIPNIHTRRATSEETGLSLDDLSGPGSAGVRVNIPNVHTRRATSEETPLSLENLSGAGAAGVRVSIPDIHAATGNARRATSEETPLSLENLSGSGAAGVRVSIPNVHTRRATSEDTPLALGDVTGSGSAGVRVSLPKVNVNARRGTGDGTTLSLGDLSGKGSAGVRLSFTSLQVPKDEALARRAASGVTYVEEMQMFMVNVSVGTPPQALSLRVSTGASDTWVPDVSQCTSSSSSSIDSTCRGGAFNKLNSTSFTRASGSFTATYAEAPAATGDRFTDVFKLGTFSIPKTELGLVDSRSSYIGVLGFGHNRSTSTTYTSIPDHLVSAGLIKSKAYSFWFSDASAKSGNIIFGAVDKARFKGELARVPAATASGSSIVTLAEMIAPGNINLSRYDLPVRVTINPTDIVSELPHSLASALWTAAGVTATRTRAYVPCSRNTSTEVVKLRLSNAVDGPQFEATIGDLVLPEEIYKGYLSEPGVVLTSSSRSNGTLMCLFGVQNSSYSYLTTTLDYSSGTPPSGSYKIGGGLLRRAYIVFDLHNREVAVAQNTFSTAAENIVEFASMGATAPGAKLVCPNDSYSSSIYSGYCSSSRNTGGGRDPWDNQGVSGNGFTGGLAIGVGTLIGLIGAGLIAFAVWFATRKNWGPFGSKDAAALEAERLEKGKGVDYSGAPPPMVMSGAGVGALPVTAPSLAPIQETGPINDVSPVSATAQPAAHIEHESVTPPSVEAQPHTHTHGTDVAPAQDPADMPAASSTPGRAV